MIWLTMSLVAPLNHQREVNFTDRPTHASACSRIILGPAVSETGGLRRRPDQGWRGRGKRFTSAVTDSTCSQLEPTTGRSPLKDHRCRAAPEERAQAPSPQRESTSRNRGWAG